jgi:transcriptional regulator with XRE-family HTH domain
MPGFSSLLMSEGIKLVYRRDGVAGDRGVLRYIHFGGFADVKSYVLRGGAGAGHQASNDGKDAGISEFGRRKGNAQSIPESLSERIKALRERCGLTRTALANRTGISRPTLWTWETGKGCPREENLVALAEALAVSAEFLRYGEAVSKDEAQESPGPEFTLQSYISEAKRNIALLAGVRYENVSINIEYCSSANVRSVPVL